MRRIVVSNLKGGSSKSTTATALAVGLARRGHRTLLIDCDAQANATWTLLGGQAAEGPTLASVLLRQADAEDAIRKTATPNLELLPADASLSGVNVALVQEVGRDTRLRTALKPLANDWDFAIADTAPTITTVLANALVWGAEVVVPADAGMYAMLGLVQLQGVIDEVRDAYANEALHLAGLLLTRTSRNNVCRDVEKELRRQFGELVYKATVPASAKVEEAHTRGLTVLEHAPGSPAAAAYEAFITEVEAHGVGTQDGGRGGVVRGPRTGDAA